MEKSKLSKLLLLLGVLLTGVGFLVWLTGFIIIQVTKVPCSLAVPGCAFAVGLLLIVAAIVLPQLPIIKADREKANEKTDKE